MALIIITAVMEVSVIIISCILYHCICSILRRERQKWILLDRDGRMKKMVQQTIFFLEYANAYILLKCHVTYLLIDKVG